MLAPDLVNTEYLKRWTLPNIFSLPIKNITFDRHQEWGQIRTLNPRRVLELFEDVKKNPPITPVKILVRNTGSGM